MDNIKVVIQGKRKDYECLLEKFQRGDFTQLIGAGIEFEESIKLKNPLGKLARDKITGFEGIVTCHAKHLYGCDSYGLTPEIDNDGKLRDTCWFDEGRIEITGDGIKPEDVTASKNGAGDNPKSTRNNPR